MNLASFRLPLKSSQDSQPQKPFQSTRTKGNIQPMSSEAHSGGVGDPLSMLVAMVFKLIDEHGSAIIQLNSPKSGEGTTTIAREIARTVARSSWCTVALIDASRCACEFVPSTAGGGGAADETTDLGLRSVQLGTSNFDVGELNSTGEFGLHLDRVRKIYSWLRSKYSLVVVDCPPVLMSGESATIASLADGIIFVVEAYKSSVEDIERSRDLLLQAGGTLFGVILNKKPVLPSIFSKLT